MQDKRVEEIKKLAHEIDIRVNLFEGFASKKTDTYAGELLFWRQVVNIYGIFADCDRAQIKGKKNLFELMNRYSLIEREEYDFVNSFWNDISELRKWFCHNSNESLSYQKKNKERITSYLHKVFFLVTEKPKFIEEIQKKDWDLLASDLDRRFSEYLNILEKGLTAWKLSDAKEDMIEEWIDIFSKALFSDKELICNVLADIAEYEKRNQNINNMSVTALTRSYERQLESGGYSASNIEDVLNRVISRVSNKEIIYQSIRNSGII